MTSSTDIAAAIPRAARYAVERGARRETREDFERLAMLGDEAVEALVDQLRRSVQPPERALAALLAAKLPVEQALPRLADVVELEKDSDVLAAAAEALGELPGAASPSSSSAWPDEVSGTCVVRSPPLCTTTTTLPRSERF